MEQRPAVFQHFQRRAMGKQPQKAYPEARVQVPSHKRGRRAAINARLNGLQSRVIEAARIVREVRLAPRRVFSRYKREIEVDSRPRGCNYCPRIFLARWLSRKMILQANRPIAIEILRKRLRSGLPTIAPTFLQNST